MNEPWEWDEADVLSLISNQIPESLTLDYKECDALRKTEGKRNELSKDVSAFANSAGGVLVYGLCENGHIPTNVDRGYDPNEISKEWIEQVINSRIHRRIDGIRINPICLTGPTGAHVGRYIYVVYVPQSLRAPHMAADNRFYKRFNFESVPMAEYEVRDVSRRLIAPNLRVSWSLLNDALISGHKIDAEVVVENDSPIAAEFALIRFYLDRRGLTVDCHNPPDNVVTHAGQEIPVCTHVVEWRGNLRLPIWSGPRYRLESLPLYLHSNPQEVLLFWEAQASLMPRKSGISRVEADGDAVSVSSPDLEWHVNREQSVRI